MTVSSERRRAHIVMPAELVDEIDAQVGPRGRSRFVQEAVEEKLRRQRLQASLAEMAGSLADVDIPEWETRESTAEWLRALRQDREIDNPAQP